jgi:hypothetical protein
MKRIYLGMATMILVSIWCVLTVGNIGGVQITILVCSKILFFTIFTYSDFSGQVLEFSKLPSEDEVCYESYL